MTEMPLMGLLGGSLYGVAEGENSNLTKKCKVLLSHTINYRQPSVIPACKHHPPSATPYKGRQAGSSAASPSFSLLTAARTRAATMDQCEHDAPSAHHTSVYIHEHEDRQLEE